jgi:xylulokinase
MDSLNRRHTELSATEQKICCLLKIRLSSKEIANLLYLSPRTVETHRLNIRRKLHIDRTLDISNYLNTVG